MIHDLDIVLAFVKSRDERGRGLPVLSQSETSQCTLAFREWLRGQSHCERVSRTHAEDSRVQRRRDPTYISLDYRAQEDSSTALP